MENHLEKTIMTIDSKNYFSACKSERASVVQEEFHPEALVCSRWYIWIVNINEFSAMKMPFGGRIIGAWLDVDSDRFSTILGRCAEQLLWIPQLWMTSALFSFDWPSEVTLQRCRDWKLNQNVMTWWKTKMIIFLWHGENQKWSYFFMNRMNLNNETKCLNG